MTGKSLGILAVTTLVLLIGAAVVLRQPQSTLSAHNQRVLPDLKGQINDIGTIILTSHDETVTVTRKNSRWTVKEKFGYAAAMDYVRGFLIGLAELKIVEPKTKKPELYEKLGLLNPREEKATSTMVTLKSMKGDTLAEVILGTRRGAKGDSTRSEFFIRKHRGPQTWLAIGRLNVQKTADSWIDRHLLNIDSQRIHRVQVTHLKGEVVSLEKQKPEDKDFQLLHIPSNKKVQSQFTVNNIADTIAHLTLNDVRPQQDASEAISGGVKAVLETFDGLRVSLLVHNKDDQGYATVSAEFDPQLVTHPEKPDPPSKEDATAPEEEKAGKSGQAAPRPIPPASPPEKLQSAEEVQQEVKTINERAAGWVYLIPTFRANNIAKHRKDLLEPKT